MHDFLINSPSVSHCASSKFEIFCSHPLTTSESIISREILCCVLSRRKTRCVWFNGSYGSYDKTLIVWDAETDEIISGPLKGHTGWFLSVVFRLIKSGLSPAHTTRQSLCGT